jgi:hypothetical protein
MERNIFVPCMLLNCAQKMARFFVYRCSLVFLLLLVNGGLLPSVVYSADFAILILHSYHQEYPWTKGQNDGFISALAQDSSFQNSSFYTENLDTKRAPFSDEYREFFFHYLAEKYAGFQPRLIFCTDDNALQFLIRYKASLFPGVPVVFSGVNNLTLQNTLDASQYVGVFEKKEIAPNISFIKKVKPGIKTVYFVGDGSSTYEAIKVEAEREMDTLFPQLRYAFFSEKSLPLLLEKLESLNDGVIILTTIGGFNDDYGSLVPLHMAIDQIRSTVKLPIFSMEDAYVHNGVVGGYVTSGRAQGEIAAALAARILKGEAPESIPLAGC